MIKILKPLPIVGEVNLWPQLELTPREQKDWEDTKTALLYAYGAFGGILYKMMAITKDKAWFTDKIWIAATDGKVLYLNPKNFFQLNLKKRIFAVCHEIFHAMLDHPAIFHKYRKAGKVTYPDGKVLPYDEDTMQAAGDCIINACLVYCRVGELDSRWFHKPHLVPHTMALLEAYRVIYKQKRHKPQPPQGEPCDDGQKGKGGSGAGEDQVTNNSEPDADADGQIPFDKHLPPGTGRGKSVNEANAERNKVEWDSAVTAARHTMKQMGVGSQGLDRLFEEVTKPDYDWINTLRHCFNRVVGQGRETWEHLDPEFVIRGIGAPGRQSHGAGIVVGGTDSSGSIDDDMLSTFNGHFGIIIDDVKPKELWYAQCDDRIHQWEYIDSGADLPKKVLGGGGTSFIPVFDKIESEQLRPDCLVYFTDCMGTYPKEAPQYPVIWASITPEDQLRGSTWGNYYPPFGEVIYIPLQPKRSRYNRY